MPVVHRNEVTMIRSGQSPFWDGVLMHIAKRVQLKHGYTWVKACEPKEQYPKGQAVENAVPTCFGCLTSKVTWAAVLQMAIQNRMAGK